ncbi:restriction endonuclease subunit S [Klebsiella aerogenes]|uniref:restriction endonuclease subunit S n=1 Tax=Klebsiella aerogenes TaxID=548 RepID=UPI002FEA5D19|nr:restriction endonuclease subunit S [Klebsiella aerogenes]
MAKYKAYPEYKDSGVESLDTIPKMWSIKKLKYIFEIKKRIAGKIGFDVLSVTQKGIKIKDIESGEGQLSMDYSKYQRVYPGEFAMNHMDLLTGYVDISNYDGVTSPDYRVFAVRDKHSFYSRYYLYLLQDGYKQRRFFHLGQGSAHLGRWRLPTEAFNEIVYPCPSLTEQIHIASFLDHETAKIDNLIEKQQQLIELLKEKRQAVISHAVTKGLNPDVPMKDSGVEWLGEVPAHWGVTRAKFISKIFVPQRNKPVLNSDSGIFWVTMENMNQHYITFSHQRVSDLAASQSGSKILPKGAVIASCVGNFGVAAINKVDVIINQQLQAFQPVNVIADYLLAMVSISKNYFELIGTAATLIYVNKEGFENLPVLVPPESEQISICKFINDNNEKFELLIDHSINQINLLLERRTALISAAVTGKIDVRDWVAPDTQDVEEPQEATA